jgi:DNA-binding NtrC family response regulator
MGQAFKPIALVVEDDEMQRQLVSVLLEESEMDVIQCESAEAAELVLEKIGIGVVMLFTDVNLAGRMTGAELATIAAEKYPDLNLVVTSGTHRPALPDSAMFMPKPWRALEILRAAERSMHH